MLAAGLAPLVLLLSEIPISPAAVDPLRPYYSWRSTDGRTTTLPAAIERIVYEWHPQVPLEVVVVPWDAPGPIVHRHWSCGRRISFVRLAARRLSGSGGGRNALPVHVPEPSLKRIAGAAVPVRWTANPMLFEGGSGEQPAE